MAEIKTSYLGLELKNPVIVGASNLVTDMDALQEVEDAGAAAIVYKSLFEEQIQLERAQQDNNMEEYSERHAEMVSLFPKVKHAGPDEHLYNLKKVVDKMNIPVIASLNCVYDVTWAYYAKKLEETGAAAIELNMYSNPRNAERSEKDIVDQRLAIMKNVKQTVSIPVSVKLSPFYTNILGAVHQMDETGVDGFVLFNRIFQPDIDIHEEQLTFPWFLSCEGDYRLALRFAGMLHGNTNADLCGNTGVFNANQVIQLLLAGADVVQIVSTLYRNGIGQIKNILTDLEVWMNSKGYQNIDDFKGKVSKKNLNDPFSYRRSQYVDILLQANDILKKYPMR